MTSYSASRGVGAGNGGGGGIGDNRSETDFQRLSTTIATNIQKILQNGNNNFIIYTFISYSFNVKSK